MTQIAYVDVDEVEPVESETRVDRLYTALLAMEEQEE